MTKWARQNDDRLEYPNAAEFQGISNWGANEPALRRRGYMPLVGEAEPRLGAVAVPIAWHVVERNKHKELPVPHDVDDSYIQIDEWRYDAIPAPPEPELRRQFTKGELLEALQACGLYDAAKAIYVNDVDLQIAWAGFADIDMDYPAAQSIMAQYPELFSAENIEKLQRYITFGETEANNE